MKFTRKEIINKQVENKLKESRLKFIKDVPKPLNVMSTPRWLYAEYQCDCGNKIIAAKYRVNRAITRSCGCLQRDKARIQGSKNALSIGEANANSLYRAYRTRAVKKGINFKLSRAQFMKITQNNCTYCGEIPDQEYDNGSRCNGVFKYNGIDRVDNELGYTITNSVACCKICNYMKLTLSKEKFLAHINKINMHLSLN